MPCQKHWQCACGEGLKGNLVNMDMEYDLDSVSVESNRDTKKDNPFISKAQHFFESVYKKEIERLAEHYPQKRSLVVDFRELEKFDVELADELLDHPGYLLEACHEAIQNIDLPLLEAGEFKPRVRFRNLPKDRDKLIRNLSAEDLGTFISVEGIVRQITDVMPKLIVASWQCRHCGNTYDTPQDGPKVRQPAFCECRHRDFVLVPEKSQFVDYQKIQIQEPLEKLRGNEQAGTLDVYLSEDLVNRITAGDKTRFYGLLELLPSKEQKTVYGRVFIANYLEETQKEFEDLEITPEEETEIRELSKNPKIYELLIQSVAPSIYGHENVKEAIVLQMFGGARKSIPGNPQIRGNIHVLLIGDPGTGKSQMLQATKDIAPKSIYVAGKTTSGVGLTASAVKDDFGEGGWTLKAGALVLASGGMCMADELDKLDDEDRSAMHEAMEQGMISVAKAGIVTRFHTDTSVLAAANPKFSRFDSFTPFIDQINLAPSLISRFDLFFMIRDVLDRTKDEQISQHILKTQHAGELILQSKRKGKTIPKEQQEQIRSISTPPVPAELLRKFISFARQNVFPLLSTEASSLISDFYVGLRDQGKREGGTYAATHRQLEGLVRLSEASARVRLSDTIEKIDAERAIRLLKNSLEDVVKDPATGKIDFDIIASGQSMTQQTNLKKILSIIRSKASEMDMVPIADVIEEAKNQGIPDDRVRDLIDKLANQGDIYKPRHQFVKPTQHG